MAQVLNKQAVANTDARPMDPLPGIWGLAEAFAAGLVAGCVAVFLLWGIGAHIRPFVR